MSESGDNRWYSTGEVARHLGVSQSTIQNYIMRGLLTPDMTMPGTRDGRSGRRKFSKSTIDALARKLRS